MSLATFFKEADIAVLDVRLWVDFKKQHLVLSAHIEQADLEARQNEMPARPSSLNLVADSLQACELTTDWLVEKGYQVSEAKTAKQLEDYLQQNVDQIEIGLAKTHLWQPSELVASFEKNFKLNKSPNLKALDIGCGGGRDTVFLSKQGWQVTAVEQKNKVLIKAKQLASSHGQTVNWICCNVNHPNCLPDQQFDLILVIRYLNRDLFEWIKSHTTPGGFVVFQAFSEGVQAIGSPKNSQYIIQPKEFHKTFTDFKVFIDRIEKLSDGRPLASFIAQKK